MKEKIKEAHLLSLGTSVCPLLPHFMPMLVLSVHIRLGLSHLWVDPAVFSHRIAVVQLFLTTESIVDLHIVLDHQESSFYILDSDSFMVKVRHDTEHSEE